MSEEVTPDGCSVELYARLPDLGEAALVHEQIRPADPVLDLGCGTGRIALALARLGHPVVAVDEAPAMLARIPTGAGVQPVLSSIQNLALDASFPAVLLASNLVNAESEVLRQDLLKAAARHLAAEGTFLAQWRPPEWFGAGGRPSARGSITATITETALGNDRFAVSAVYREGDRTWHHDYQARRLSEPGLHSALQDAGLTFSHWVKPDRSWFAARAA